MNNPPICLLGIFFFLLSLSTNLAAPLLHVDDTINGLFGSVSVNIDASTVAPPPMANERRNPNFETTFLGTWKLLRSSSGVSAMHMAITKENKAILFDATNYVPTQMPLPAGNCRPIPNNSAAPEDCWAHAVEYDFVNDLLRPLKVLTNTWCSSGGFAADGTLVQAGGFRDGGVAVRYLETCPTCDWVEYPTALSAPRWYATQQILPDGSFIVVGGRRQFSYEFIPARGQSNPSNYKLRFLVATTDDVENNLYPFLHLSSDGNLFIFANNRSILFDPRSNAILREFPPLPGGSRNYPASAASALLPIRLRGSSAAVQAEVIICGGAAHNAASVAANRQIFLPAIATCSRLVITRPNAAWHTESMPTSRVMGDLLILPTADLLLLNGAKSGTSGWGWGEEPNLEPLIYRPAVKRTPQRSRFQPLTPSTISRMYHSTSAVLPDATVLVAGSNPNPSYNYTAKYPTEFRVERFEPPYLDPALAVHRPKISEGSTPASVSYQQGFSVQFELQGGESGVEAADVKVTMYAQPFTTHGYSMGQRLLVLWVAELTSAGEGRWQVSVTAPSSGAVAPPGYYLTFVVYRGVPSEGVWIQVGGAAGVGEDCAMDRIVGGKYKLGRKIGSGSFGEIFLGERIVPLRVSFASNSRRTLTRSRSSRLRSYVLRSIVAYLIDFPFCFWVIDYLFIDALMHIWLVSILRLIDLPRSGDVIIMASCVFFTGAKVEVVSAIVFRKSLAENSKTKHPQLIYEAKLYNILQGGSGIPNIKWYGVDGEENALVLDLLGPSLEDLFVYCGHKFSLKTVLMLADQMITRIEYVHSKGFLHRDIKPDNFLMGLGRKANQVYIIDFGLAKRYRDSTTNRHIPYRENKNLTGTARYASCNTHLGIEQSRRDDLESLGYVLLYFLRGSLPWQGLKAATKKQKYDKICEKKLSTPIEVLCKSHPVEFASYFHYCHSLTFEQRPDYGFLKRLFRDLFTREGYEFDYIFDWTILKYQQAQRTRSQPRPSLISGGTTSQAIPMNPDRQQGFCLVLLLFLFLCLKVHITSFRNIPRVDEVTEHIAPINVGRPIVQMQFKYPADRDKLGHHPMLPMLAPPAVGFLRYSVMLRQNDRCKFKVVGSNNTITQCQALVFNACYQIAIPPYLTRHWPLKILDMESGSS
ncbi:hypothetical protein ZIOFF_055882 [Zingiber officinale]|uniref:Protein kinase domain-containing protein n=1 Tax=Zingiber officinale TaxID=94328 RepID=A0A8J5KNW5_ZINOF|nr:hypothetical protein ZIOFF_055882 [Zingiber officinale]